MAWFMYYDGEIIIAVLGVVHDKLNLLIALYTCKYVDALHYI